MYIPKPRTDNNLLDEQVISIMQKAGLETNIASNSNVYFQDQSGNIYLQEGRPNLRNSLTGELIDKATFIQENS